MKARLSRPAVVALAALALFVTTLYGGVGGRFQCGDAAKWQYIGSILGVPHPPGSPLFLLVSNAWSHLPFPASLALRANALSAVFGASTLALTCAILRRLRVSALATAIACLLVATSEAVWTFSTEAEVYAPLGFAYAFTLHRAILWRQGRRDRDLWLLCLVYAAGFGFHYAMITLLPALVFLVARTAPRTLVTPRHVLVALACVALALVPFAWLWERLPHAPYSELPGARSVAGFRDYLLVRQYRGSMFTDSLRGYWFERVGWGLSVIGRQAGIVGVVLAPLGAFAVARRDRAIAAFVSLAALGPFAFLIGYRQGDELGNSVPVLLPLGVLVGAGFDALRGGTVVRAVAIAAVLFGLVLNARALAFPDPMANLTHDTDEIHDYPFNVPCIIEGAAPGTVVVSPFPDYGSRQIVNFFAFTDARVRDKKLTFEYFDEPPKEWTWAPKKWAPGGRGPVYVFRKDHANDLRRAGFQVTDEKFSSLGACAGDHPNVVFYRGDKP